MMDEKVTESATPKKESPCKVIKRSVKIAGHATSVTMERAFWETLERIAAQDGVSVSSQIAAVDGANKGKCSLSAALRVYILMRVR